MIKIIITSTLMLLAFNGLALAQGDHTPNVCSALTENVCAHLGHMSAINSSDPAQFVAHIMTPLEQPITDLKVVLWMPAMGHGSSPVELRQFAVNRYTVKNAYFIMPGQWEVRLSFTLDQQAHQINIPLNVTE